MNGNKYLFDTNALISFFQGNQNLEKYGKSEIYLSIISIIEYLSYPGLSRKDIKLIKDFSKTVQIVELSKDNEDLLNQIIELRKTYKIKLPDCIIAATAIHKQANLITNDKDFSRV